MSSNELKKQHRTNSEICSMLLYFTKSLEELADLLEVIQAVVKARGWTVEELEQVRAEKATKRGGFEKKILLKEVQEDC